jgi:hypothetical protein
VGRGNGLGQLFLDEGIDSQEASGVEIRDAKPDSGGAGPFDDGRILELLDDFRTEARRRDTPHLKATRPT